MVQAHPVLISVLFVLAWVACWVPICRGLMKRMGMVRRLGVDPGPPSRSTGWGSARVNGAFCEGCVRLTAHRDGWLLQMMPVFGGGKLWLPRDRTVVGEPEPAGRFRRCSRLLRCGTTVVLLYDRLADAV